MATTPELPQIKKPKLNLAERRALNGAVDSAQEWWEANDEAVAAQAHALLEKILRPVNETIARAHPAIDTGVAWVSTRLATLKF